MNGGPLLSPACCPAPTHPLQLKFKLSLTDFTVGTYQCTAVGSTAQGNTDTSPEVPFPVPNRWVHQQHSRGGRTWHSLSPRYEGS